MKSKSPSKRQKQLTTDEIKLIEESVKITKGKNGGESSCPFPSASNKAVKWLEFFYLDEKSEQEDKLGTKIDVDSSDKSEK